MKLARTLTWFVMLGTILVLLVNAFVRIRREINAFDNDMLRDHATLGRALAASASAVWRAEGAERAQALVRTASRNEDELRARWIWLDGQNSTVPVAERTGLEERGTWSSTRQDGLYSLFLVRNGASPPAAIEISESFAARNAYVRSTLIHTAITTVALAAVAALVTALAGLSLVGRPVRALVEQARLIGKGTLSHRLVPRRKDELGELASEMNAMCERLEQAGQQLAAETKARIAALEQLRHADRLMTVGKLASGIAHELGTPLNVVSGRAMLIARGQVRADAISDNARIIAEQAERMANIIRQLLDFARQREPRKAAIDPKHLVEETLALLQPLASKRSVILEQRAPAEIPTVQLDPLQIQQVLSNLVLNGLQAMTRPGTVAVEVGIAPARIPENGGERPGDFLRFSVVDQGAGMDPEVTDRVFEPFFTTKEVGEGTGLGLSVAYGIVREHGGFIEVESKVGDGSRFSVYLPV